MLTLSLKEDRICNNIFPRALGTISDFKEFDWHNYARRYNSSQALAIDVFGTAKTSPYKDEIINEICKAVGAPQGESWDIEFEWDVPQSYSVKYRKC